MHKTGTLRLPQLRRNKQHLQFKISQYNSPKQHAPQPVKPLTSDASLESPSPSCFSAHAASNDAMLSLSVDRVVVTDTWIAIGRSVSPPPPLMQFGSAASAAEREQSGHDWLCGPCSDAKSPPRSGGASALDASEIRVTVREKTSDFRGGAALTSIFVIRENDEGRDVQR